MASSTPKERPSLTFTRTFNAPPEKVWRAWTDPQDLKKWFGPGEGDTVLLAEADPRVGGRFHVAFVSEGEEHDVSGVYREVIANRKLVFTWAWKTTPERESLVTVLLRPSGPGTELTFVHEQFFDEEVRDDHEEGWNGAFMKLERLLLAH